MYIGRVYYLIKRVKKIKIMHGVKLVIDYHPALRCLYGIFRELQSVVN